MKGGSLYSHALRAANRGAASKLLLRTIRAGNIMRRRKRFGKKGFWKGKNLNFRSRGIYRPRGPKILPWTPHRTPARSPLITRNRGGVFAHRQARLIREIDMMDAEEQAAELRQRRMDRIAAKKAAALAKKKGKAAETIESVEADLDTALDAMNAMDERDDIYMRGSKRGVADLQGDPLLSEPQTTVWNHMEL